MRGKKNYEDVLYAQKNCEINSFKVTNSKQMLKRNSGNLCCHSNSDLPQSSHPGKVSVMLPRSHPNKIFPREVVATLFSPLKFFVSNWQ